MSLLHTLKKDWWVLLLTLVLSLIPLLWFKGDSLITGTDVDFSPYPQERFFQRLYTWYPRILAGMDRSNNTASLPYIGTSALLSFLGLDILTVEKLTFVIWFSMTGLAMYFLISVILHKEEGSWAQVAKFSAVLLYMVNYYNVFLWVRLQLALAALVFFPVFFGLLIGVTQKGFSLAKSLFVLALVSFVCGPMGIQPPLLFAMFLSFGLYTLIYSFYQIKRKEYKEAFNSFLYLTSFVLVFFLSSGYWTLTLVRFIFSSGYSDASYGADVYAIEGLLVWTSSVTSFLNVFRLFGDAPWYSGWAGQSYSPEFIPYTRNFILVLLSFILPIIVFIPLTVSRHKKKFLVAFFSFLILLGLFLSKGTHSPFGSVFSWLIKNFPLFWIHRAPWQKFSIIVVLGYSVLGGLSAGLGYTWLKKKLNLEDKCKYFHFIYIFVVGLFILNFNYVFVLGKMFPSKEGDVGYHQKNDFGFHHKFPSYIEESRALINSQKDSFKIFLLPEDKTAIYDWGYGGSTDVVNVALTKTALSSQYGEGFSPPQSIEGVYSNLVDRIYKGASQDISDILGFFNIKYVLQRNDFRHDFFGDFDSPDFIMRRLREGALIEAPTAIGSWDFHKISAGKVYPIIYSPKNKIYYSGSSGNVIDVFEEIIVEGPLAFYEDEISEHSRIVISKPLLSIEPLEEVEWDPGWAWPEARIKPKSFCYYFVRLREMFTKKRTFSLYKEVDVCSWIAVKRIEELLKYPSLSLDIQNDLLKDYVKDMAHSLELLRNVPPEERDETYWAYTRKNSMYMQKVTEKLFDLRTTLALNDAVTLGSSFKDWCAEETVFELGGYRYKISIPTPGLYEFSLLKSSLPENLQQSSYKLSITNLDDSTKRESIFNVKNIAEGTEIFLEKGAYAFEVVFSGVFSKEVSGLEPLDVYSQETLLVHIPEVQNILKSYKIKNVYSLKIVPWEDLSEFSLSFDYYIDKGAKARAVIIEESNDGSYNQKLYTSLNSSNAVSVSEMDMNALNSCNYVKDNICYERFSTKLKSSVNSKAAYLYIFAYAPEISFNSTGLESLYIENFSVEQQVAPSAVLSRLGDFAPVSIPNIKFQKINPTKYKIQISSLEEPVNLVFNESFHKGWRLYFAEDDFDFTSVENIRTYFGKVSEMNPSDKLLDFSPMETLRMRQLSEDSHVVANGFANSWEISPDDADGKKDFSLIMEFRPQRTFYFGVILSLSTIFITGFILFLSPRVNNARKN